VRALEREREQDQEAAVLRAKQAPSLSIGAKGFTLSSPDSNFALKIRGVLQMDMRTFFNNNPALENWTWIGRPSRPMRIPPGRPARPKAGRWASTGG